MERRIHIKPKDLAINILKGIALTGMVLVAASNLQFGPRMLKALMRDYQRKNKRAVEKSIRYLHNRGYVKMSWLPDGQLKVEITRQGKKVMEQIDLDEMRIEKPPQWDKKWRIVIFDVPNTQNKHRLAFTQHLKNMGFKMVQKSVWVHPYPSHKEIMVLRKFYGIESLVTYLETAMVEDDEFWREKFDLLYEMSIIPTYARIED